MGDRRLNGFRSSPMRLSRWHILDQLFIFNAPQAISARRYFLNHFNGLAIAPTGAGKYLSTTLMHLSTTLIT
jgi:hypothetical protein